MFDITIMSCICGDPSVRSMKLSCTCGDLELDLDLHGHRFPSSKEPSPRSVRTQNKDWLISLFEV